MPGPGRLARASQPPADPHATRTEPDRDESQPACRRSGSPSPSSPPSAARAAGDDPVSFNRDIRPILSDNCSSATAPTPASARPTSGSTAPRTPWPTAAATGSIAPGDPEASELIYRVDDRRRIRRDAPGRLGQGADRRAGRTAPPLGRAGGRVRGALEPRPADPRPAVPGGRRRLLAARPDRPLPAGPDRGRGASPLARGRPADPDPPPLVRPDRPAADARRGRRLRRRRPPRTPTSGWSTACSPRPATASGWRSTGSTWSATPTPSATTATRSTTSRPTATT